MDLGWEKVIQYILVNEKNNSSFKMLASVVDGRIFLGHFEISKLNQFPRELNKLILTNFEILIFSNYLIKNCLGNQISNRKKTKYQYIPLSPFG